MNRYLSLFNRTDAEDPLKVFRFAVEIENFTRFAFMKVSGLSSSTDSVAYRSGGDNTTERKSPGLTKFPDITLERGQILAAGYGDLDTLRWYTQVFDISAKKPASSGSFRRTLDIVQFNKEGVVVKRWRVQEAWPKDNFPISDLDALQSNNSVEKLVIVHEGWKLVTNERI